MKYNQDGNCIELQDLSIIITQNDRGGRSFKISGFPNNEKLKDFAKLNNFEEFESESEQFSLGLKGLLAWDYGI